MTNVYKPLDTIFPCGDENRLSGEVVNVHITILCNGVRLEELAFKRKAWYVNASVNAFHMHRGIVREFTDTVRRNIYLSRDQDRRARRLVALAVLNSYIKNRETETQVYVYTLDIGVSRCYWLPEGQRQREIIDLIDRPLRELVDGAVEDAKLTLEYEELLKSENLVDPQKVLWSDCGFVAPKG